MNTRSPQRLIVPLLALGLAAANLHLFTGGPLPQALLLEPEGVLQGQWWRLLTHPFVHVSWYHLVLDATATLLLLRWLASASFWLRVMIVLGAWLGSLIGAWLVLPGYQVSGFCGLSGIAHGLMLAGGWLLWRRADQRATQLTGLFSIVIISSKCALELSDLALLGAVHLGDVGQPIVASHAGGAAGALAVLFLAWCALAWRCRLVRAPAWDVAP